MDGFGANSEGKKLLRRLRLGQKDNIKVDL